MPIIPDYPWYCFDLPSDEPLQQGDIFLDLPVILPQNLIDKPGQEVNAEIANSNAILLSQSCDIQSKKIESVLLCPVYESHFLYPDKWSEQMEKIKKGQVTGQHLLNKCRLGGVDDFWVVDFRTIFSLSLSYLETYALKQEERVRLLPPYREHLSQSFARFFMRVGLPEDIDLKSK